MITNTAPEQKPGILDSTEALRKRIGAVLAWAGISPETLPEGQLPPDLDVMVREAADSAGLGFEPGEEIAVGKPPGHQVGEEDDLGQNGERVPRLPVPISGIGSVALRQPGILG